MTTAGMTKRLQRESAAVAVFGTWMISGLFLDGWAHEAEKPETFFSPWHGILYSGFVAALVWFSWDGWRQERHLTKAERKAAKTGPADRLVVVGLIIFIVGAIGDGLWHEIFGIEVDLEALVSPSHLALLIGGFLMLTSPVRLAAADASYEPATWRRWFPQGITLMLAAALVLFFTQYLSVFEDIAFREQHRGLTRELDEIADMASILATNGILVLSMLFAIWRWRPPFGAFTVMFGVCGVLSAGLEGFARIELALAFVLAGLVADFAVARRAAPLVTAAATSLVLWSAFFAIADASYGIGWSPELWSGAIVLATASSALASFLLRPAPPVADHF